LRVQAFPEPMINTPIATARFLCWADSPSARDLYNLLLRIDHSLRNLSNVAAGRSHPSRYNPRQSLL